MDANTQPDERRLLADGEAVWSWRLDADVNLVTTLARCAGDGDKKPDHQGERGISRNTIARGMPGCFG